MQMTEEGLALIRTFEGFRGRAYRCPAGIWTIGYGHTSMAGPPHVAAGMIVSRQEAGEILRRDVAAFAEGVRRLLRRDVSSLQFSALVSFAYNVGLGGFETSSVLKAVNAGDFAAVPRRLQLWVKANGRTLPGLVKRRAAEAELFIREAAGESDGPAATQSVTPERGKSLRRSSSALAALLSAAAAAVSAAASQPVVKVVLALLIILAALWIVRQRYLKSKEEGV